jgi:serine protease AprX
VIKPADKQLDQTNISSRAPRAPRLVEDYQPMRETGALLLLSTLLCSGASAPKSKVAKDFAKVDPGSTVNVIVQWKDTPDATANQKVVNRGGSLRSVHQSIKAAAYRMPMSMVNDLANDPSVDHISIDHPIASKLDFSAAAINASAALARGFDGTGIGVAVIDSGMVRNGDLTLHDTVVYNEDFTGRSNRAET